MVAMQGMGALKVGFRGCGGVLTMGLCGVTPKKCLRWEGSRGDPE